MSDKVQVSGILLAIATAEAVLRLLQQFDPHDDTGHTKTVAWMLEQYRRALTGNSDSGADG